MITALVYLALGLAIGAAFFAALALNTRLYLESRPVLGVFLHLARLGGAIVAFALIASRGPAPLLAALVGFVTVRLLAVRRLRRAAGS